MDRNRIKERALTQPNINGLWFIKTEGHFLFFGEQTPF